MSEEKRDKDGEAVTDVDVDASSLAAAASAAEKAVAAGGPAEIAGGDTEPRIIEPPKRLGVRRLKHPTLVGVAPPSPGSTTPSSTDDVPRISYDIPEEETTTLIGKMIADARAETRGRIEKVSSDVYTDETVTSVGDGARLIATAHEAFAKAAEQMIESQQQDTEREPSAEEVTARREAINVDAVLERAARLKAEAAAEAEARKKKAHKRTYVGLGEGPLSLPSKLREALKSEPDTVRRAAEVSLATRAAGARGDEEERVTLSSDQPVPLPGATPSDPPPAPVPSTDPAPATEPIETAPKWAMRDETVPLAAPPVAFVGPPTPKHIAVSGPAPITPHGGVPANPFAVTDPYPSGYVPSASRSDAAFAQTHHAPSQPAKKSRKGIVLSALLLLVAAGGGIAYVERAPLRSMIARFRPPATEPVPATAAVVDAPPVASAPASAPIATASAAPSASASVAPTASAPASASASASPHPSASAAKPGKKPPVKPHWPRRAPKSGGAPVPVPAPAPTSDTRGF